MAAANEMWQIAGTASESVVLAQDAQVGELVLDLLEGAEHGLPVDGDLLVETRLCTGNHRATKSAVDCRSPP